MITFLESLFQEGQPSLRCGLFSQALPPVEGPVEEEVVASKPATTCPRAAVEAAVGARGLQPLRLGPLLPPDSSGWPVGATLTFLLPAGQLCLGRTAVAPGYWRRESTLLLCKPRLTRQPVQCSSLFSGRRQLSVVLFGRRKGVFEPVLVSSSPEVSSSVGS